MKLTALIRLTILIAVGVLGSCNEIPEKSAGPPNVLLISVDDLNNWIEPMGGHPQAGMAEVDDVRERLAGLTN